MSSSTVRTILFNLLVILTILFIYFFFFPKKSYTKEQLDIEVSPIIDDMFNQNINNMKIASKIYFEENEETKVTIEELKNKNLLAELKDSNNEACNKDSYIQKEKRKTIYHLECNDKKDEIIIYEPSNDKFLCIYQYEKKEKFYTEYSDWSTWSLDKIDGDELTNVETKIEQEKTNDEQIEDATIKNETICENGYTLSNNTCKKRTLTNNIKASLKYNCKDGYTRSGTMCYKGNLKEPAQKKYSCPSNSQNVEFEVNGETCDVYSIRYKEPNKINKYECNEGFELKNNKCYKYETYKYITYYRYQKRDIKEKIDIKWSIKDDNNLLTKEYSMVGPITCEF